jgi:hypothetical protein
MPPLDGHSFFLASTLLSSAISASTCRSVHPLVPPQRHPFVGTSLIGISVSTCTQSCWWCWRCCCCCCCWCAVRRICIAAGCGGVGCGGGGGPAAAPQHVYNVCSPDKCAHMHCWPPPPALQGCRAACVHDDVISMCMDMDIDIGECPSRRSITYRDITCTDYPCRMSMRNINTW